jgi:hypothetical protein
MSRPVPRVLIALMLVYAIATLVHFAHNAEFLADYPNMPDSFSRTKVYVAWLGLTVIGGLGYVLVSRGRRFTGLALVAVYALLGLDSLGHYALAPMSAHTAMMNATILVEVALAGLLLIASTGFMLKAAIGKSTP